MVRIIGHGVDFLHDRENCTASLAHALFGQISGLFSSLNEIQMLMAATMRSNLRITFGSVEFLDRRRRNHLC